MARTFKQPSKLNLRNLPVLINDTTSYSEYFEVSELNRIFHAGRNGFLLRGTEFLRRGSSISVEIVDRFGNPVFATPINGYSEGGSRLISIEIFQATERGPGFLTIVGEAAQYADGRPVPSGWVGRPNVKWTVPIQIEPRNENRTRIRLANEPSAEIQESNFDITRIDQTTTVVSDYTASLTYDFEVEKSDGYAILMVSASGEPQPFFDDDLLDGVFTGSMYRRIVERLFDNGIEVPTSASVIDGFRTASVSLGLYKVLNESTAITQDTIQFNGEDFPTTFLKSGSIEYIVETADLGNNLVKRTIQEYTSSVVFQYVAETITNTASTSSIINFRIPFARTTTGEISKVKISAKEANENITSYQPFAEFVPGEKNLLVTGSAIGNQPIGYFLENITLLNNWHAGEFLPNDTFNRADYEATESINYPLTVFTSSVRILEGAKVDNTASSDSFFFGTKTPIQLYEEVEYTLRYTAVYTPTYVSGSTTFSTTDKGDLDVYLCRTGADSASRAESAVVSTTDNPYGRQLDEINTKTNDKSLYEREVNFRVPRSGLAHLRFVSNTGFWSFGNIEIFPAVEKGFNPDEIIWDAENNILVASTNIFKIQFLNWNDEPIDYEIITSPIFISGARDPGIDGFTVTLSNENHTFKADPTTNAVLSYVGGGTEIEVLNGATPLAATLGSLSDGFFSSSISSSTNITAGTPSVNGDIFIYGTPGSMPDAADSASITFKITARFSGATYNFIKKQSFTKVSSGASGSSGTSPVLFTITPESQTVAAGSDGSVPGPFQDVVVSGSQGITPLVYNQSPTLGNGEYKIVDVSGSITVIDTTPATQVVQVTAASEDTNQCKVVIEYKELGGTTGSLDLYFTIVKSKQGTNGDPGTNGTNGSPGPGIVFRGVWTGSLNYSGSSDGSRRDAVLYTGSAGPEIDGYYMALQNHINQEPSTAADTAYWQYLGDEDFFVAAKIAIFQESYIYNTLNVGTNSTSSNANITIFGGNDYPYISIGQTDGQGYGFRGIWIGVDTGSAPQKIAKFSVSGSNNGTGSGIFFNGEIFDISGSINAQGGSFTGNISVGEYVLIGPNAIPPTPSSSIDLTDLTTVTISYPSGAQDSPPPSIPSPYPVARSTTLGSISSPIYGELFLIENDITDVNLIFLNALSSLETSSIDLNNLTLFFVQNGSVIKTHEILTSTPYTLTDGESFLGNDFYVTSQGTSSIAVSVQYTGSIQLEVDGFADASPFQPFFTSSLTASSIESSISIRGQGIFVDRGSGPVNILELIDGGTGLGTGTQDLQDITTNGATTNNAITITNTTDSTTKDTGALIVDGGVGIEKNLVLGGTGSAADWVATSDIRLKNVIGNFNYGLHEITQMEPIKFAWKDDTTQRPRLGLSAQNIKEIIPEVVFGGNDDKYVVSYNSIIPVLVSAIKELKIQLDSLREIVRVKD